MIGKLNSRPDEIPFIPNLAITLLALLASIIFEWSKLDLWIQTPLYDFQTHLWWLNREDSLTKFIFYDGIKGLFGRFLLSLIGVGLFNFKDKHAKFFRQKLSIVILSFLMVRLSVNLLKASTHIPCPMCILLIQQMVLKGHFIPKKLYHLAQRFFGPSKLYRPVKIPVDASKTFRK